MCPCACSQLWRWPRPGGCVAGAPALLLCKGQRAEGRLQGQKCGREQSRTQRRACLWGAERRIPACVRALPGGPAACTSAARPTPAARRSAARVEPPVHASAQPSLLPSPPLPSPPRPPPHRSAAVGAAPPGPAAEAQAAEASRAELHFAACVRPFLREYLGPAFSRVLLGDDYSGWAPKDHGLGRLVLHQ